MGEPIDVAAAIILRGDRYLIAQRKGGHLAGKWEFPGGRVRHDESIGAALERELEEELGLRVEAEDSFLSVTHDCGPNGQIRLWAVFCRLIAGEPTLRVHSRVAWATSGMFSRYGFAPVDVPIVRALRERDRQELRELKARTAGR